jgi:hypothetical protein
VTRLIPDLDDELVTALARIEELLLILATWAEDEPDGTVELPAPLAARVALYALHRIQDELVPTQSRSHPSAAELPRLFGPDGHEHRPLRLVEVAQQDLALLAAAAARIGHALALEPGSELADAIETGAEAASPAAASSPVTGVELVETLARVNVLLDLATTPDTETLTRRLWSDGCNDIVLTTAEEFAYTRTASRMNSMWAGGNALDRWTY